MKRGWSIYVKRRKNGSLALKNPCNRLLVYVASLSQHSLVVQPHLRKILDPPLPCSIRQTFSWAALYCPLILAFFVPIMFLATHSYKPLSAGGRFLMVNVLLFTSHFRCVSCRAKSSLLFARQLTQWKCSLCSQGNYEVKLHVKSASFSTDNSRISRLSIFYRISNHKNFIPKYLDNALQVFAQTAYSVYSSLTHT